MLQLVAPPALPPACLLAVAGVSSQQAMLEGVLAVSCGAISLLLLYLAFCKRDLPFRGTFVLVGAFLLACGVIHFLSAAGLGPWDTPIGVVVALLAAVAVIAVALVPHKALSLRSPIELERAQRLIEEQIAERRQAEERLVVAAGYPNQNPYPLVETDLAGKPTYLNPAAKRQFPDLELAAAEHPILAGLTSLVRSFRWGEQESITREVAHGAAVFRQKICYL
ncbi:MAG TPA: hypothetical protein VEU62_11740, partial [Bryobacterales bacterium]|nr:hypothetical protein [Bryobacterales bacterium]